MLRLPALVTVVLVAGWASAGPDDIYLEDGGYKGILLAINENVPYHEDILPNLKSVFVEASEALYRATEYEDRNLGSSAKNLTFGKHFAQIKVLVPKSWPRQQQCDGSISELYGNADFRVTVDSPQWGRLLSTQMVTSECREPGDYTIIPRSFVEDLSTPKDIYGPNLGKAILHEWAHLRWGLREESNYKEGGHTCIVQEDWNLHRYRQPVRCSTSVGGVRIEDPNDETKCIFYPELDTTATASIMFFRLPFYSKMYTFCDSRYNLTNGVWNTPPLDVMHDPDINHPHNHVCQRQSAWQVLRDHPDFDRDNAAPLDLEFDFEANLDFQCVQQPSALRIVLVLDTSGSMSGARIEQMGSYVALFLQSLRYNETDVGMLRFASSATQLVPIIPLNSDDNLQRLLDNIPTVANGGTSIGSGLLHALEMLEADGESAAGGLILVFTDGEETTSPYIREVRDEVIQKEAIVYGLLMDGVADDHDLVRLANDTGGDFCIYEDSGKNGTDYYQCLMDIVSNFGTSTAAEIKTEDMSVPSGGSVPGTTLIDSSFEDSLRFTLSWTTSTFLAPKGDDHTVLRQRIDPQNAQEVLAACDDLEMTVTAPDGTHIDKSDPRYEQQNDFPIITIDASGFPEGEWKHEVMNPIGSGACSARLRIEGFPDTSSPDDDKQPILMTAHANKISINVSRDNDPRDNIVTLYATLKQGLSPVLDAEVTATVEGGSNPMTVAYYDNGAGADNAKDDGIYSAYFYQYSGDGVYSVRAFARGVEGQTSIKREERELVDDGQGSYQVVKTESRVPVSPFERAAIGGAFEVATNGESDINELIPPARINDFRRGEMAANRVELVWTAVGASMNDGTATMYDLRMCTDSTQKFDTCNVVDNNMLLPGFNLSIPQPSGSPESAFINLDYLPTPEEGASYFFMIKAVDEFGNSGVESNVAQIQGPVPEEEDDPSTLNAPLIIGVTLGATLLVGVIISVSVGLGLKKKPSSVAA